MSRRILVASSLNAGAEALVPVIRNLRRKGIGVKVLSYAAATVSFRERGLEPDKVLDSISQERCRKEMADFSPAAVLTGTQVQDQDHPITLEQMLWLAAKESGKGSVAVLDTWGNYAERFSVLDPSSGPTRLTIVEAERLVYLPTKIAIMDEYAKSEMIKLDFPEEILEVTGSPYFEHVLEEASKLTPATRSQLLSKPVFSSFHEEGKLVVFMSDPIERYYQNIGFDEKSVLQSFLRAIEEVAEFTGEKINVIVRPHPSRNENAREAYECETSFIRKVLHNPASARGEEPENEYSMEELLHSADLLVGTFNNPLITAVIMRGERYLPVISYQPGLAENDLFHYMNNPGHTTLVTDKDKLAGILQQALSGELDQKPMESVKGAVQRIADLVLQV